MDTIAINNEKQKKTFCYEIVLLGCLYTCIYCIIDDSMNSMVSIKTENKTART